MKHLFTFLAITALSLASNETLAVGVSQKSLNDLPGQTALQEKFGGMSTREFAALTPKEIAKKTGKKMPWRERILFKIVQKRIKKQLAKGIQPSSAEGEAGGSDIVGGISSIILGVVGWLLCLLIFLNPQSVLLGILFLLGLVCGFVGYFHAREGLERDESPVAAIIGMILNAPLMVICAVLVIWLIATIDSWLDDLKD